MKPPMLLYITSIWVCCVASVATGNDRLRRRLARMLRAARLKSWKSPKPASITASRCSRSLARKHRALPASKVANCPVRSRRASVWSSSGCAMR
eukprot:scaffold23007_cov60-Phaeocystis_antarctica.AAC.11